MKTSKLFFLFFLFPFICFAQNSERLLVDFLGVDFSSVDIVGASESKKQFHNAFKGINTLLHTEPKKYNVSKFLSLDVESINTEAAIDRIVLHSSDNYLTNEESNVVVEDIIAAYPSEPGDKLLIIATELNKPEKKATYIAVVFNGETKEIVFTKELIGKTGGFGLRNYWAGSLYDSLKKQYNFSY